PELPDARLLDLSSEAIFVRDSHDLITYWNGGAETLYGWPRGEALGRLSSDLLRTELPAALSEARAALEDKKFWKGGLVHTSRDGSIIGRKLFEVFPDIPNDLGADGVRNLRASLDRVEAHRCADAMNVQRYPIQLPPEEGGGWEERYWSPMNSPVFDPSGKIVFIVHRVEDV